MSRCTGAGPPGSSSTRLKYVPRTSANPPACSSDTGLNVVTPPFFEAVSSAVAELPAFGQPHARLDRDLPREIAGGIERHRVPLQIQHVRRHHHAAFAGVDRRKELELTRASSRPPAPRRETRTRSPDRAATPPARHWRESSGRQLVDLRRRVIAGQPLRIEQHDGSPAAPEWSRER